MEKKIVAQHIDKGFGFPIVLENVPMVKVRGEWTPYINYNNLAREVLRSLIELDGRLTGNQVKFVRTHFEMTLQAFAERFNVSHPAVMKWERAKDRLTGMNWGTEKDIRLFTAKALEGAADDFLALYGQLETVSELKPAKVTLDAERVVA